MSGYLNKVTLIGNLGGDPETNTLPSGSPVTNITLATNESWTDKGGNKQERTEWHRATLFNRLAEIAGEYLHKGSKIYLEGSLRTRKYTTNDGIEKYVTEIIGSSMQMLDSKADSDASSYQNTRSQAKGKPTRSNGQQQRAAPPPPPADFDDLDDIPFR